MSSPGARVILLDVGSTNARGWLVSGGRIVDRRTLTTGVRATVTSGSSAPVRDAVASLIRALSPDAPPSAVAAAGMITSPQGLREVAHVMAPASTADLARGAVFHHDPALGPVPVMLVPGVKTAGGARDLSGDVMRGEEVLTLGLLADGVLRAGESLLNSGSHWKLIDTDGTARITRSRTSLGGELMHAVQSHTLLGASLPSGPLAEVHTDWLEAGARASSEHGLLRALFGIRLLDQLGEATPAERLSWLAGACVNEDIRGLERSSDAAAPRPVLVTGAAEMPRAWCHLLQAAGWQARPLPLDATESAFITGLLGVVAAAGKERA